jgi:hypothetical protein
MAANNTLKLTEKGAVEVKEKAKTGIDTLLTDKAKDTVSDKKDLDYLQLCELHDFGISSFLKYHLGLDDKSIESEFVKKHFLNAIHYLERELV